jgi:Uma2 family endonuclease
MSAEEFLAWSEGRPGRYELHNGEVVAMSPEQTGHAKIKYRVARVLDDAIAKSGCRCWMLPDGPTVRVDAEKVYEPDALVYCGAELPTDTIVVPDPVVLVEVLSPSTKQLDKSAKFTGYFKIPSVHHYLIVDPARQVVIHHQRGENDLILTRIIPNDATLQLAPPGLTLDVARIFAA